MTFVGFYDLHIVLEMMFHPSRKLLFSLWKTEEILAYAK